jgi:hypothetical protein
MFSGITYQPTDTYQVYSCWEDSPHRDVDRVIPASGLANMIYHEFTHWIHHPEEKASCRLRVQDEPCMREKAYNRVPLELNRDRLIGMLNQIRHKGDVRLIFDASRLVNPFPKRKSSDVHPESAFNRYWTDVSVYLQQELHHIILAGNQSSSDSSVAEQQPMEEDIYVCAMPNDCLAIGGSNRSSLEIMVDIAIPWHLILLDQSIRFECEPSELSMVASYIYVLSKPEVRAVIRDRLSRFGKILLNEAFQDTGATVAPFRISSQYIAEYIAQQLAPRLNVYIGFTCKNELYLQTMSTAMI